MIMKQLSVNGTHLKNLLRLVGPMVGSLSHLNYATLRMLNFFVGLLNVMFVDGKARPVTTYSNRDQHHTGITVMKWNPSGKRLVTGDKVSCVFYCVYFNLYFVAN